MVCYLLYTEIPQNSIEKLLKIISDHIKTVGYKLNSQKTNSISKYKAERETKTITYNCTKKKKI